MAIAAAMCVCVAKVCFMQTHIYITEPNGTRINRKTDKNKKNIVLYLFLTQLGH